MSVGHELLEDLAQLIAEAGDDELTRLAAASAVLELEGLVEARLGAAEDDALVLLARRFARAHRLAALGAGLPGGSDALLQRRREALRDPAGALLTACCAKVGAVVAGGAASVRPEGSGADRLPAAC